MTQSNNALAPRASKPKHTAKGTESETAELEQPDAADVAEAGASIDTGDAAEAGLDVDGVNAIDDIEEIDDVDDKAAAEGDGTESAVLPTESAAKTPSGKRRVNWTGALVYGGLPGLALLLAVAAGFSKWQEVSTRDARIARIESVKAATDSTIALLSYRPDTVDRDLIAARDRLTGSFRDSYTEFTTKVVIPGAKQRQISAVASVPAAGSVSANPRHAVTLVFVNQTVIVGQDAPTDTASTVRVTLDKVGGCWLISGFDPI